MARRRFFVDEVRGGTAEIAGDEAAHLTRVLRVENGEKFEISDGVAVWLAEVTEARKSAVRFQVIESVEAGPEPPPVHLYVALFKFDRLEWLIEKATELGVQRIVPVETARSDHALFSAAEKRVDRWRRIAREASQQSRRVRIPQIDNPIRAQRLEAPEPRARLDELAGTPPLLIPADWRPGHPYSVLLGPEGGWTDDERQLLDTRGWRGASIANSILRAETAGVAALSILAHEWILRCDNAR